MAPTTSALAQLDESAPPSNRHARTSTAITSAASLDKMRNALSRNGPHGLTYAAALSIAADNAEIANISPLQTPSLFSRTPRIAPCTTADSISTAVHQGILKSLMSNKFRRFQLIPDTSSQCWSHVLSRSSCPRPGTRRSHARARN